MKKIICLFLLIIISASCEAQIQRIVGVRANSMGNAFTGLADDSTSIYWNPAGACQLSGKEFSISYFNYRFNDPSSPDFTFINTALVLPLNKYTVGFGIINLSLEDWRRDEGGNIIGTYLNHFTDIGLMVSYKVKDNLFFGGNIKWFREQLDTFSWLSFVGVDISMMYKHNRTTLGIVSKNILLNDRGYEPPQGTYTRDTRIGLAHAIIKGNLTLDTELNNAGIKIKGFGCEYNIWRTLYIRIGRALIKEAECFEETERITYGLGYSYKNFTINYSYEPLEVRFMLKDKIQRVSVDIKL